MTTIVRFTVPAKPVGVNSSYLRSANRRLRKTDAAVEFQARIQLAARKAMRGAKPLEGDLWAFVRFIFDSERPDIDGPIKPVLDSMQRIVFANDRQVRKLTVERFVDRTFPRVEIEVLPWFEDPRPNLEDDSDTFRNTVRPSKVDGEPA